MAVLAGALTVAGSSRGQLPEPPPLLPAEQAWLHELPDVPAADGALDNARAYVPVASGDVVALDRTTGRRIWTRALPGARRLETADGAVYVGSADAVHALDGATGDSRWHAEGLPPTTGLATTSDLLIVPTDAGAIVALRRADGQPAWRHVVEGGAIATIVADGDRLYAASADMHVSALAASDGRLLWRHAIEGAPLWLARGADRLFAGTSANMVVALDPRTGRTQWRWTLAGTPVGAAATTDRVHVAALDNLLRAFNSGNGHQRWRQALPTRALAPPRIAGDEIAVTGVDPVLATFDLATGRPAGTYAAVPPALAQGPALIDVAPVPAGVHIVLILRDGRAIGLRRAGAAP